MELINFFNNNYIFNDAAFKLINASSYSVISTYIFFICNFIFLFFLLNKINSLYKSNKINFFNVIIIIGIYGSFAKLVGFSVFDEIIISILLFFYLVKSKITIEKNSNTILLFGLFFYILIHGLVFYKAEFSLLDHFRYFRMMGVLLLSILIIILIKNKQINYNISLDFCFIFIIYLISYSLLGDILYENFSYLRITSEPNPISLFYVTGGPGKFVIQNFVVSGSRNFTILVLLTIYFIYKSNHSIYKKSIIFASLLFLSVYNHSNTSTILIVLLSTFIVIKNFRFLVIFSIGYVINYLTIIVLFIFINLFIPWDSKNFFLENTNQTVKYILTQVSVVPLDIFANNQKRTLERYDMDSLKLLNIDSDLESLLIKTGLDNIKKITEEKLDELTEIDDDIKKELITRKEIIYLLKIELKNQQDKKINSTIVQNQKASMTEKIILGFDVLKERKRLGVKKYTNIVRDEIKIKKGDYYLFEGIELVITNHALAEVLAHTIGVLDKDRKIINLIFGSGINSHRTLLPVSISKLIMKFNDADRDDKEIKKNLTQSSFSSYTLATIIFEIGFVIILFFILFIYLGKKDATNLYFLFALIGIGLAVNFNDAVIFYLVFFYFINEKKT
jgi:hypothetical protein